MAITASGIYFLTLEKQLTGVTTESWEAEDNKVMLDSDTDTPDFNLHDFRADVATEVTGTNWSSGGVALTGTELTIAAGGVMTFDATDVSVATTTISGAMASIYYANVGAAGTDMLFMLHDFVTAVSTSAGTFGIQWNASGLVTADLVP